MKLTASPEVKNECSDNSAPLYAVTSCRGTTLTLKQKAAALFLSVRTWRHITWTLVKRMQSAASGPFPLNVWTSQLILLSRDAVMSPRSYHSTIGVNSHYVKDSHKCHIFATNWRLSAYQQQEFPPDCCTQRLAADRIPALMFVCPCIMNWLYINYQLHALIIIYS